MNKQKSEMVMTMKEATEGCCIKLTLTGVRTFRFRLWILKRLIKWISPYVVKYDFEDKPLENL